jgi:hypothetical protein
MRFEKQALIGAAILAAASAGFALKPVAIPPAYAACGPEAHIDGTTAESTKRLMERAGYTDIRIDQKGCDNVWHVFAVKDGKESRYAVEPGGKIYPEGD